MGLPSFICIGAQKAGTTWLYAQLRTHPDIWMPPVKELHYFDYHYSEYTKKWGHWHITKGAAEIVRSHVLNNKKPNMEYINYISELATKNVFTEEWYKNSFDWRDSRGKLLGDITPEYSTISEEGINYLKELLPNVKIIYLIRDPLSRALSQLRMNLQRVPIDGSPAAWIKAASDPALRHRGAYADYIPRWCNAFSEGNILFVPYGRIAAAPLDLLRDIERFLGVKPHTYPKASKRVHVTERIEIPAEAKSVIAQAVDVDRRFLEVQFDSQFTTLI